MSLTLSQQDYLEQQLALLEEEGFSDLAWSQSLLDEDRSSDSSSPTPRKMRRVITRSSSDSDASATFCTPRTMTAKTLSSPPRRPPKRATTTSSSAARSPVKGVHRNWAATLNHPELHLPNWQTDLSRDIMRPQGVLALVATLEVGKSGTPHLQMCLVTEPSRFRAVKALFPSQIHLEVARDPQAAWRYCLKDDGERVMWDTRYNRDKKKAMREAAMRVTQEAYQLALSGDASSLLEQVTPEYLFKNAHSIYRNLAVAPQLCKMTSTFRVQPLCIWLFGGSGCGKTTFALNLSRKVAGRVSSYFLPVPEAGGKAWFDGFTASHQMVLMDEFRHSTISLPRLCQVLSSAPTKVECKGASVNFTSLVVVVISPASPWDCYSHLAEEDLTQVVRRVDVCLEFRPRRSPQQLLPSSAGVSPFFVMAPPVGVAASVSSENAPSVPVARRWAAMRDAVNHRFDQDDAIVITRHWWEVSNRHELQDYVGRVALEMLDDAAYRVVDHNGHVV